jgi:hypothetical protein
MHPLNHFIEGKKQFWICSESNFELMNFLKTSGIPHYMLIDKNGIISEIDAPHPDSKTINDRIEQLLNQ